MDVQVGDIMKLKKNDDFPADVASWKDEQLAAKWDRLLGVRDEVQKALEAVRAPKKEKKPGQIGSSQEAHVTVSATGPVLELLRAHEDELVRLLIVSRVTLEEGEPPEDQAVGVKVEVADGEKCPRCWNYWIAPGSGAVICPRCASVLG